jgi:hypothetical protein
VKSVTMDEARTPLRTLLEAMEVTGRAATVLASGPPDAALVLHRSEAVGYPG